MIGKKMKINDEEITDIVIDSLSDLLESLENDIKDLITFTAGSDHVPGDVVASLQLLTKKRSAVSQVLKLYMAE